MEPLERLVLLGALGVFFAAMYFIGRNELRKRRLACPRSGASAKVDVVQRYEKPDVPVRVKSCDLLPDPNKVDCEQECLEQDE